MKRPSLVILALFLVAAPVLTAAPSAGAGISVFIPETLMTDGKGSISFEQGLSTSLGLGRILEIPLGFVYQQADGWRLSGPGIASVPGPSLFGDALIPYAGLKAHLGLGALFVEASGGGLLSWSFRLAPVGQALEAGLAKTGETVSLSGVTLGPSLGFGYFAGGAFGVTIGQISVDLGATWRSIMRSAPLKATLVRTSGTTAVTENLDLANLVALLQGVSVRIGGSFAF